MEMTMIKSGSTTSSRCYYSLAASQPKSSYYFNLSYSPPIIFSNNCTISTSRSSVVPIQSCKISSSSTAIGGGGGGFGGYWSSKRSSSFRCFSALTPELKTTLDKVVTSNKVVVFMKGNKDFPQCGFSNTVVQILKSLNVPFETLDILENDLLRQSLKLYSNWPTFPQLYIDGEFFGGCDITVEAYKSGELQEVLEKAICS